MVDMSRGANEHVLEIRYRPNSRVLDHRGSWAETLSAHMSLSQWEIVDNRVDIYNPERLVRGFVGFRNCGFVVADSPTPTFFSDTAQKFLRSLFELPGFGSRIRVERFGLRSRFCTPYDGTFDELRDSYLSRYVTLQPGALDSVGRNATVLDVGVPLNFRDALGHFNTNSGPMRKTEFPRFFTKNEPFPEVGLFFDIDYWLKPNEDFGSKETLGLVARLASAAWERHEAFKHLLLGPHGQR